VIPFFPGQHPGKGKKGEEKRKLEKGRRGGRENERGKKGCRLCAPPRRPNFLVEEKEKKKREREGRKDKYKGRGGGGAVDLVESTSEVGKRGRGEEGKLKREREYP